MARSAQLQVEVVSRDGRLWHGAGSSVQIPAVDGSLGILPGRQPILAMLGSGHVIVETEKGTEEFTVSGGFASVDSDFVTIVADSGTVA